MTTLRRTWRDDPHVVEIEYPVLSSLVDVIITDVSGTVKTNTTTTSVTIRRRKSAVKADMIEWLTLWSAIRRAFFDNHEDRSRTG